MEAIELYRKAGRHPEAAKLLAEIAQEVVKSKANPMRARRLFVLAALEVEKFRAKTLNVQVEFHAQVNTCMHTCTHVHMDTRIYVHTYTHTLVCCAHIRSCASLFSAVF